MTRRGDFKHTIEEMRELAKKKGGKCLSKKFEGINRKLEWECKEGHKWKTLAQSIIVGYWCKKCVDIKQSKTIDDMRKIASEKGFKCLSDTYVNNYTYLEWGCAKEHKWKATPSAICVGSGCPYCAGRYRTVDFLISLAIKKNGKCLSTEFKTMGTEYEWECSKGHTWKRDATAILSGSWCAICAGQIPTTLSKLEQIAFSRGGRLLDKPDKINKRMRLNWQCKHGHTWNAVVGEIKDGSWCPTCRESRTERKCRHIFEEITGKLFPKTRKALGCRLELDGYCEEIKLAFEYNGQQHYRDILYWKTNLEKQKERDARKLKLCKKMGITLIVVPYWEAKNMEKFIKNKLRSCG